MWEKAVLPIKQHMLYKPMTIDNQDILFAGMLIADIPSGVTLDPETQHLQCFLGGLFALSAKAFKRPEDLEIAAKLTDGCVWAYRSTPSGIMPETFYAFYCDDHTNCPWNESRWQKEVSPLTELPYGFSSIRDGRYLLRYFLPFYYF
jgi:mannosyl-oligosaccharide alpha-1,2-mannosidase